MSVKTIVVIVDRGSTTFKSEVVSRVRRLLYVTDLVDRSRQDRYHVLPFGITARCPMLTVKLDPRLRAEVKALAAELGVSTSEVVRDALRRRLDDTKRARDATVYEVTRDLCGIAKTPDPTLSAKRMSVLLRERHARKRAR